MSEQTWNLSLNRYQRDNLFWLVNLVGWPHGRGVEPFTFANTGDWIGEIGFMLEGEPPLEPNMSQGNMETTLHQWRNRTDIIAAACHQAWAAFERGAGRKAEEWRDAPEWQRDMSRQMVVFYDTLNWSGQSEVSVSLDLLCDVQDAWCKMMRDNGWNFGVVKDTLTKTHPMLIPYIFFPDEEKRKHLLMIETYLTFRKLVP